MVCNTYWLISNHSGLFPLEFHIYDQDEHDRLVCVTQTKDNPHPTWLPSGQDGSTDASANKFKQEEDSEHHSPTLHSKKVGTGAITIVQVLVLSLVIALALSGTITSISTGTVTCANTGTGKSFTCLHRRKKLVLVLSL